MPSFNIEELESVYQLPAIQSSFIGLYRSLGMITAIASSPDKIDPSEWIEQLQLRGKQTDTAAIGDSVKPLTDNLVGWWDNCLTFFDHGHQLELPGQVGLTDEGEANEELMDFASGYLEGYDWLSQTWQTMLPDSNGEGQRSLLVLNLILGRFIDEAAIKSAEPELYEQLPDIRGCFQSLPSLISAVGMLGHDLAHNHQQDKEEKAASQPMGNKFKNIGRNAPCPCGSGKKFKKCCLH